MVSHRGIHRPNAPPTHSAAFHACGRRAADPRIGGRGVWGTYATGQSTDTALTAHAGSHSIPRHKIRHGHAKPTHGRGVATPASTAAHSTTAPTVTPTEAPAPTPTPTSAGDSTAPVTSTSCSGAPNTPGGPDPWGGCWPGPGNTGVPAGVSLSTYTGPCTISAPNTVIDAKLINCALDVTASGVTIQDSKIKGQVHNNSSGALVIKITEIDGGDDQSETVGGDNITILGSNLNGDQYEFHCGSSCQ